MSDQVGYLHKPISLFIQPVYPVFTVQVMLVGDLANSLSNALGKHRVHLLCFDIRPVKTRAKPHG